tara:strand:- start:49 stop:150 length:102 start_codon:yes stop_codon:yes gene_type:complete
MAAGNTGTWLDDTQTLAGELATPLEIILQTVAT